jgi:hypothetical protein
VKIKLKMDGSMQWAASEAGLVFESSDLRLEFS